VLILEIRERDLIHELAPPEEDAWLSHALGLNQSLLNCIASINLRNCVNLDEKARPLDRSCREGVARPK